MNDLPHTITTALFVLTLCGLIVYGVVHPEMSASVGAGVGVLASLLGLAVKSPFFGGKDDKP